jgi:predicted DNA binding CopG/RHH family protein
MTQKKEKESFVLHLDMLQDVKHMGIEEKAQKLTTYYRSIYRSLTLRLLEEAIDTNLSE